MALIMMDRGYGYYGPRYYAPSPEHPSGLFIEGQAGLGFAAKAPDLFRGPTSGDRFTSPNN
jgi:hypothetical protein